jgi:hypothetical protein
LAASRRLSAHQPAHHILAAHGLVLTATAAGPAGQGKGQVEEDAAVPDLLGLGGGAFVDEVHCVISAACSLSSCSYGLSRRSRCCLE